MEKSAKRIKYEVQFGNRSSEYQRFNSLEELKEYLERNISLDITSKKINGITKIVEEDIELPDFVKKYNKWLDTKPMWIPF